MIFCHCTNTTIVFLLSLFRFQSFTFTFLLNQKEKNSSKTKHKKTEQRNNVEHKAIILKDKKQEKSNTFLLSHVSMGYQIQ